MSFAPVAIKNVPNKIGPSELAVRILLYTTLHMTHATSGQTLATDPCTGKRRLQVSSGQNEKRPTNWVRPSSQRRTDERKDRLEEK